MEPWYNVFSYWGLILFILRPWLPFSIFSILIANLVGTLVFVYKARPSFSLGAFLIVLHAVPAWFTRRDSFEITSLLGVFLAYVAFLALQGKSPANVYYDLVRDPPKTIHEYLVGRLLIKS
jgi:hypothetical protein